MRKLMLLFAAVGMVFFAACEDKTPTEIGEKPGEEQPGEEDPKEDPEPIAGTCWVGEHWVYGDEKVAVENQEHELIFADNAVFYIADSDRGVWTNEGTYTYDPPKIVLKVTEVDPAAGTVEGDVLTVGAFASMDVVIPMEFKKQ